MPSSVPSVYNVDSLLVFSFILQGNLKTIYRKLQEYRGNNINVLGRIQNKYGIFASLVWSKLIQYHKLSKTVLPWTRSSNLHVQDIAKLEQKLYTAFLSCKAKLWWSPRVPSVPANNSQIRGGKQNERGFLFFEYAGSNRKCRIIICMENMLPWYSGEYHLKHVYAQCWNMIEHIVLCTPPCKSFSIMYVICVWLKL